MDKEILDRTRKVLSGQRETKMSYIGLWLMVEEMKHIFNDLLTDKDRERLEAILDKTEKY